MNGDRDSAERRSVRRKALALAVTAAALTALVAPATSGGEVRPDPAFGTKGAVTTQIRGGSSFAAAITVLPSGKIVAAGQVSSRSGAGQVLVARYRSDGRLDRGFGSGGIFRTALPKKQGPFNATAIARDRSTGKLLVAGGYGQGSILLLRLTADGRLDRSFGRAGGVARANTGGIAESVSIQRDGRILVGASNANANGRPMVVARFKRNGALDRRFGTGGIAESLFWDPDLTASAGVTGLATTADGAIVASGHLDYIGGDGHGSAGVVRLTSIGQPDPGFGSGGHVEIAFTEPSGVFAQWFPCAMAIDSLGRITVTGDGSTTQGASGALLTGRLTSSGAPDAAYGPAGDGKTIVQGLEDSSNTTCGAALGADGSLTAGVGSTLAQLGPTGAANPGFAPDGLFRITRPRKVGLNAVARSGERRIVVAGSAGRGIYVGRYLLR